MQAYLPGLSEPARRWLRFAGLLAALALLCWVAYGLRPVFTPLLVAAAIAYVLNPLVTWIERTRRVRRLSTVTVAFALFGAVFIGGGLYGGSRTIAQLAELPRRVPGYVHTVGQWVGVVQYHLGQRPAASSQPASPEESAPSSQTAVPVADWWRTLAPALEGHTVALAQSTLMYAGQAASNVVNLVSLLVLIPVFTFYFLWRFNDGVAVIRDHLPMAYRDAVVDAATTIDAALASFFRGRLIVCLIVATLSGLGWTVVGVPYSLPLGLLAGVLNLVPFLSLLALPAALLSAYLGAVETGHNWLLPVVLAMGVYMAVQALESFLLSPMIEGKSSGLHPLVIVVALLIGAQLADLLGMLLAIPVASSLKTFAARLVLPEIRRLAGHPVPAPPAPPSPGGSEGARARGQISTSPEGPPGKDEVPDE